MVGWKKGRDRERAFSRQCTVKRPFQSLLVDIACICFCMSPLSCHAPAATPPALSISHLTVPPPPPLSFPPSTRPHSPLS